MEEYYLMIDLWDDTITYQILSTMSLLGLILQKNSTPNYCGSETQLEGAFDVAAFPDDCKDDKVPI
eukprot:8439951-Ditylum_brightwellii.AAC.1